MNKKLMKELSIKKWEYLSKTDLRGISPFGDTIANNVPEVANMRAHCPYCELFDNPTINTRGCISCPLLVNGKSCYHPSHPFGIWLDNRTPENAQVVLNLIKNIKITEIFCDSCGEEITGFYEDNKDGSFTCLECSIKIDDGSEIDKGF